MAGDWIKFEKSTLDKPEVLEIAERLGVSQGDALLYCLRLWSWADSNSRDGILSISAASLDSSLFHRPGVSSVLLSVGWLKRRSDGQLELPGFAQHWSHTAKRRADDAKRKQLSRKGECPENVRDLSGEIRTPSESISDSSLSSTEENERQETSAQAVRDGPVDGQTWGGFLSREWRFYYRGTAPSQRDGETLKPYFDDFAARLAPEKIRDGIRAKDRDASQPTWDFQKWLYAKLGISNGPTATGRPITRIMAQSGSAAAIKRKTVRVGSESANSTTGNSSLG